MSRRTVLASALTFMSGSGEPKLLLRVVGTPRDAWRRARAAARHLLTQRDCGRRGAARSQSLYSSAPACGYGGSDIRAICRIHVAVASEHMSRWHVHMACPHGICGHSLKSPKCRLSHMQACLSALLACILLGPVLTGCVLLARLPRLPTC